MENFYNYCVKEWKIVTEAPLACFVFSAAACVCVFFIMSWYYSGRIESLREQVKSYEVKLSVVSADEAFNRMMQMQDKLKTAMDVAESRVDELLLKKDKVDDRLITTSWLEPICVSLKDTEDTKRQILVYNLMGKEMKIDSFFDKEFCEQKTKKMKEQKETRERDANAQQ